MTGTPELVFNIGNAGQTRMSLGAARNARMDAEKTGK